MPYLTNPKLSIDRDESIGKDNQQWSPEVGTLSNNSSVHAGQRKENTSKLVVDVLQVNVQLLAGGERLHG